MVYGKILYNNIKEYTPKWYPTIPYSQTVKPVFGSPILIQEENLKLHGLLIIAHLAGISGEALPGSSKGIPLCGKF